MVLTWILNIYDWVVFFSTLYFHCFERIWALEGCGLQAVNATPTRDQDRWKVQKYWGHNSIRV